MRAVFTRQGHIFTTGFTRMSQRELGLWDPVTQLEAWVLLRRLKEPRWRPHLVMPSPWGWFAVTA